MTKLHQQYFSDILFFVNSLLRCSFLSKHNINTSSIEQYYNECISLIHLKNLVIICKICILEEGSLRNRLSFHLCGQTRGYILHTRQPLSLSHGRQDSWQWMRDSMGEALLHCSSPWDKTHTLASVWHQYSIDVHTSSLPLYCMHVDDYTLLIAIHKVCFGQIPVKVSEKLCPVFGS